MAFPTPAQAEELLNWAEGKNPGPWTRHSRVVAEAARTIAESCRLDADKAFAFGLLHDIGRYAGVSDMRHVYDGYTLLLTKGFDEAAQICLTHSYPLQNIDDYSGRNDCSPEQYEKLKTALKKSHFTDYDRLIQFCDSIALVQGVCLMEKRLVDVARRHGANPRMLLKWERLFEIHAHFDELAGKKVYSLFPEIVANTFA